ncbi:MAG: transcription antitermination factor NusB [Gemmatimonadota bacterium]
MPLGLRTKTRARALQILYAWEMQGTPRVVDVASGLVRIAGRVPAALEDAEKMAQGVIDRAPDLDKIASVAADNWRVERLGVIERNVLRLAIFELTTEAAPPKVVINEAIQLAHWFGGLKSPAFINGVLDRVAHSLGRL